MANVAYSPDELSLAGTMGALTARWTGRRLGFWWTVESCVRGVMVYCDLDSSGREWAWLERFDHVEDRGLNLCGDDRMASKYISAALARKTEQSSLTAATDPTLFKDRPAVAEFMTVIRTDDNKPRDPSVLMVCITPNGVRVGLKDEDAGGWLWREGATFIKALNAIEECLQSGDVTWSVPGGRGKGKR